MPVSIADFAFLQVLRSGTKTFPSGRANFEVWLAGRTWFCHACAQTVASNSPLQKRESTGASFLYWLDWKSKHFNWNGNEWKATQPSLRVFSRKLFKWQSCKSCKIPYKPLIILRPVYSIHTNSLFWVIFEKLPFCHFPPPNTSIRDKGSQI